MNTITYSTAAHIVAANCPIPSIHPFQNKQRLVNLAAETDNCGKEQDRKEL
jgi:hypothetical protein